MTYLIRSSDRRLNIYVLDAPTAEARVAQLRAEGRKVRLTTVNTARYEQAKIYRHNNGAVE